MTELPKFSEFVQQYRWARLIDEDTIGKRASKILTALKKKEKVAETPINQKIINTLRAAIKNPIKSTTLWRDYASAVKPELFKYNYYEFVNPNNVSKKAIDDNNILRVEKDYKEADIVREKVIDPETNEVVPDTNSFKLSEEISDYNVKEP